MSMHVMTLDANFIHSPNSACYNRADWQSSCAISISLCRTPSSTILPSRSISFPLQQPSCSERNKQQQQFQQLPFSATAGSATGVQWLWLVVVLSGCAADGATRTAERELAVSIHLFLPLYRRSESYGSSAMRCSGRKHIKPQKAISGIPVLSTLLLCRRIMLLGSQE
ncbi:hypothetical protein ACFX2A_012700 [Malus domestica]